MILGNVKRIMGKKQVSDDKTCVEEQEDKLHFRYPVFEGKCGLRMIESSNQNWISLLYFSFVC